MMVAFWAGSPLLRLHALDLVVLVVASVSWSHCSEVVLLNGEVELLRSDAEAATVMEMMVKAGLLVLVVLSPGGVLPVLLLQPPYHTQPDHLRIRSLCLELLLMLPSRLPDAVTALASSTDSSRRPPLPLSLGSSYLVLRCPLTPEAPESLWRMTLGCCRGRGVPGGWIGGRVTCWRWWLRLAGQSDCEGRRGLLRSHER